jgi:hypothetical protein
MDERLRFIARLLEGETMTDLCVEFGISCKTGYIIYGRHKQSGAEAFTYRSRRPCRYANQLPPQVEAQIVGLKKDKPHWGTRKIRVSISIQTGPFIGMQRGAGSSLPHEAFAEDDSEVSPCLLPFDGQNRTITYRD